MDNTSGGGPGGTPVDVFFRNSWFDGSVTEDEMQEVLWDEEKWIEVYRTILGKVGEQLGDYKIKVDLEDEGEIQMRARINDLPVRVKWWQDADELDYPGFIAVEMKCPSRFRNLHIWWNAKKIPKGKDEDPDDDWDDEDEQLLRVFVAKGVFIEGDEAYINQNLAQLNYLPKDLAERLYSVMQTIQIADLQIDGDTIYFSFDKNVIMLTDPVPDIMSVVQLTADIAEKIKVETDEDGDVGKDAPIQERVNCTYCGSNFILAMRSNCPNCGAGYSV